jgi:hypothetical protein
MKDSPNGKRYGKCDPKGRIVEAYGFDLSPVAARYAEFIRLAEEGRAERAAMGRLRRRATIAREGISQILETAREYGHDGEEWQTLSRETEALARIGAHPHEHPAPVSIVDIEVVLYDPALGDLQMPTVGLSVADCRHDPSRLSGFEDDDNLIRLGALEVGLDEFVAPAPWRLDNRGIPSVGLLLDPGLELFGGAAQHIAS